MDLSSSRGAKTDRPLSLLSWSALALLALGQVNTVLQAQRTALDEDTLVQAAAGHPDDGALWFNLGVVRAQKGETATAIAAFEHSVAFLPDKLPAYRNIVALHLTANDTAAALPVCQKALALYPADLELLQNCAYAFSKESRFAAATGPLRTLRRARPKDVAVWVALITALNGAKRPEESSTELDALLSSSLLSRDQAEALAQELSRLNAASEAQRTYAYIAKNWPGSPSGAAEALGLSSAAPASAMLSGAITEAAGMIRQEHYVDALHFLDKAREQFPNQPALEYDAALTDVCLQRFAEAISILKSMKQQGPPSARVEFLLGGSYEIEGQEAEAESAYREAARLDPDDFTYYRVLAALLQKERRFPESMVPLQRALALAPDDSQILQLRARALEKQGDVAQAVAELEHAVRSDPDSRRAHAALSALYFRQGRTADAAEQQALAAKLEDRRIQQWTIWGTASGESNAAAAPPESTLLANHR